MTETAKRPNKGGRPQKTLSELDVNKVEDLASRLTKAQVADYFGVSEATFRKIEERQPEVSIAYKRGKADVTRKIASKLIEKALEGDNACMMFYLKTRAGWRETDLEQTEKQPVTINLVKPDGID